MAIPSRSTIILGPAKYTLAYLKTPPSTYDTTSWFTDANQTVEIKPIKDIGKVNLYGMEIDSFLTDEYVTADIPVDPRLSAGNIAALWPYANTLPGTGLFTAHDCTLIASGADSSLHTIISAAVVKMPDLNFSIEGPLIGPVGIMGLRGDTMAWTDASSLITAAASGGTFTDSTLTNASLLHQPYTVTFGTDLVAIDTLKGVQVKFALDIGTVKTQMLGTWQRFLRSVSVAATFEPVGQAYDKVLTMLNVQGATNKRGSSLDAVSQTMTVAGVVDGATHFTLSKGALHQGSYRFGNADNDLRDGELAFVSTRQFTAGVQGALFTIA